MSDKFQPLSTRQLTAWVFTELAALNALFGIPRPLFFMPSAADPFKLSLYGHPLETPFGVAAGPHSQMAQNLIAAWLCGARFMELKTVQTLDELEVSKPCIDMQDEGYNVEWSQELKIHESFEEYLRAWVLIHVLHRKLGLPGSTPGIIFNMSAGYNLEGLLKPNVQWFLEKMKDAGDALSACTEAVAEFFPEVRDIPIPSCLSDSITLSTMHGCPPDEIGKISAYLIEERGLHTNVKLNPTLLGPERLRRILNQELGFKDITAPDAAFGHDLKYPDAVKLLHDLRGRAERRGVIFGVKLSNTLEVENHRKAFDAKEKMMYMSGRPLQALTVHLAAQLSEEFGGRLLMSYAGGADAFNAAALLAAGMKTITVCSDLLKTGGYLRLLQYLEQTAAAFRETGAQDLPAFIRARAGSTETSLEACALANLQQHARNTLSDRTLQKETFDLTRTKTSRKLDLFDCIKAPCTDECPIDQKVPQYMACVREGRYDDAIAVIREDNPLPSILGRACNHKCENTCVRSHLDEPLAIREIKRFVMDQEKKPQYRKKAAPRPAKVAIIGGGPCGLSAAYFLTQAGYPASVFEARPYPGGMVSGSIPGYRATDAAIEQDLEIVRNLGVDLRCNQKAGRDFTLAGLRKDGFKYIVMAAGAQLGQRLNLEGEHAEGVFDGLEFLRAVREKKAPKIGPSVGVIGGGDVAMDCARTAARLTHGTVSIVYRRTIDQMPAQREELQGLLEEGIPILSLLAPKALELQNGKLIALRCAKMQLGEPDASGRRRPVETSSEEVLPLDTLIVAIGQQPLLDFFGQSDIQLNRKGYIHVDPDTMETSFPDVFAGGDAVLDGPETIVKAMSDGRKIAQSIRRREEPNYIGPLPTLGVPGDTIDAVALIRRKAHREFRTAIPHLPKTNRHQFDEIVQTLPEEAARQEAARCLDCHLMCSLCAGVCPNRAIVTYQNKLFAVELPELQRVGTGFSVIGKIPFRVAQPFQVAVQTDFCNECGNCATFCPTAGRPYRNKPRLYLKFSEFNAESDNAFMVFRRNDDWALQARFAGATHGLALKGKGLTYANTRFTAQLDAESWAIEKIAYTPLCADGEPLSLLPAARMAVLLNGIRESLPYLPTAGEVDIMTPS
ncbi:MAG TPA: putative selenate reductase subunit YgfK [Verrucomicrobia bacterium]|nr:MAG: putative selenate reductase subunit YgfK [Lentisphaerae bacterium GWF2_57_35]HBA82558.1 putative selenate reductase subunit YgfK [Verrucomicrobiota bacterium]